MQKISIRPSRPALTWVAAIAACVAALSGTALAAATITGLQIKNRSLTGVDVKANALTGVEINEAKLKTVPSAKSAATATSAGSAKTATSALTAASASAATTASGVSAGSIDAAALGTIPAFRGRPSDEAFTASSSYRPILLTTEDFDTANMHAANSTDVVIPRAGIWRVEGNINMDTAQGSYAELSINLVHPDASNGYAAQTFAQADDTDLTTMSLSFSTPVKLQAGDVLTMRIKRGGSKTWTVYGTSWFAVSYIGAA